MKPNQLFGSRAAWWGIPQAVDAEFVETPVGEVCLRCGEAICDGDFGVLMPYIDAKGASSIVAVHQECSVLSILGHSVGVCTCTDYAGEPTSRLAALECWRRLHGGDRGDDG